jgi:hypothetical protein
VITMRQVSSPGPADVEFDGYVPLTATWSTVDGLLDPPRYVELRDENGYFELKFHPQTGILIEAVLAAAPGMQIEQQALAPRNQGPDGPMPYLSPDETFLWTGNRLAIRAYPDYLSVSFGHDPEQWAGPGPVIFGLTKNQGLTAIAAQWSTAERESVLADF